MSTPKTLVLTRPLSSARHILEEVEAAFGGPVRALLSPVIDIKDEGSWPEIPSETCLIVTSRHALRGPLEGRKVYCVGARTAEVVRAAGGDVRRTCGLFPACFTTFR